SGIRREDSRAALHSGCIRGGFRTRTAAKGDRFLAEVHRRTGYEPGRAGQPMQHFQTTSWHIVGRHRKGFGNQKRSRLLLAAEHNVNAASVAAPSSMALEFQTASALQQRPLHPLNPVRPAHCQQPRLVPQLPVASELPGLLQHLVRKGFLKPVGPDSGWKWSPRQALGWALVQGWESVLG